MAAEADAVEYALRAAAVQEQTPPRVRRSYALQALIKDELGPTWTPPGPAHTAEADTEALLALVVSMAPRFISWVQANAKPFHSK
jgi:hypothetical protein